MNEPHIPHIRRVEIDESLVRQFESEEDFTGLAVDILVEVTSFVCLAGSLLPAGRQAWNRDEAVIGGHLVRLYKLINAILDQTCQQRRETSFIYCRLAFECIINLRYLIAHASDELFRSYRAYSLKHEYKLLRQIEENIEARGGKELPIERRMINSIHRSFEVSGITVDALRPGGLKNWGGKNIFKKAQAVGLEMAYLALFGGGSHSVHGNWQDLLEYHLEETNEGGFKPDFEWHRPRPQVLNAIALQSTQAVIEHLQWIASDRAEDMLTVLQDLQDRILLLERLHEEFLSYRTSRSA